MEADLTEDAPTMDISNTDAPIKRRALDSIDSNALFSGGRARRPIAGLREMAISMNSRRNAATSSHLIRGIASAAIDHDDSGTYDPNEDRVKPASTQLKRTKKAKIPNEAAEENAGATTGQTEGVGHSGLTTFSFNSKEASEVLRSPPPSPFDDNTSDTDTIRDDGSSDTSRILRSPEASSIILSTKRKSTKPDRLGVEEEQDDQSIADELAEDDPRRRGCKACFESGHGDCPLIQDAYAFPCAECVDGGIDCELIIPPEFKKVCRRCRKKRISCSYKVDGGKGVDACDSCKELGVTCCAGPLRASHAKKFQKARDVQTAVVPEAPVAPHVANQLQAQATAPARNFVACNQCRGEGFKCNLKRHQTGPCKKCKLAGQTCEFVLIPPESQISSNSASISGGKANGKTTTKKKPTPKKRQTNNRKQKLHHRKGFKGKKKGAKGNSRNARRRPEPFQPRSTNGINHIIIRTSYAHPIIFNHDPAPNGSSPCHFCSQPFFGIFGHGWLHVEVIPLPHGYGYEEIGEGPNDAIENVAGPSNNMNLAVNGNKNITEGHGRNGSTTNIRKSRDLRGHNQRGEPRSQMCFSCTSSRVRIMSCGAHSMKPVDGAFDPDAYSAQLQDFITAGDIAGAQLILENKVCSICSRFAEHHCVSAQDICGFDCECNEDTMVCAKIGCGLRLCGTCMHFLEKIGMGKYGISAKGDLDDFNVLDRLVRFAESDVFHYEDGVRADAAFLTTKGELNQRFECGFGEVEMGEDEDVKIKGEYGDDNKETIGLKERYPWTKSSNRMPGLAEGGSGDGLFGEVRSPAKKRQKNEIEIIELSDDED